MVLNWLAPIMKLLSIFCVVNIAQHWSVAKFLTLQASDSQKGNKVDSVIQVVTGE